MESTYVDFEKMCIAYTHVYRMLQNRGYVMVAVPPIVDSLEFAKQLLDKGAYIYSVERPNEPATAPWATEDTVAVFFCTEPKLGVKHLRDYVKQCESVLHVRHLIVMTNEITPFASSFVAEQRRIGQVDIEVFTFEEKQFDLISHQRVPPHTILTEKEKAQLMKQYYVKRESQLPHRQLSDPLARYYHIPVGTVTRTMYTTGTMERVPYYRIVMDDVAVKNAASAAATTINNSSKA